MLSQVVNDLSDALDGRRVSIPALEMARMSCVMAGKRVLRLASCPIMMTTSAAVANNTNSQKTDDPKNVNLPQRSKVKRDKGHDVPIARDMSTGEGRRLRVRSLKGDIDADSKELLELVRIKISAGTSDPIGLGLDLRALNQKTVHLVSRVRLDRLYHGTILMAKMLTIAAILWVSWKNIPVIRKLTESGFRRAEIKLLPYWDWTGLYYKSCLVTNPYYEEESLVEDDCQSCLDTKSIPKLSDVSHSDISEKYLKTDTPFIVTDSTYGWNVMEWSRSGSPKSTLNKFYESSQVISNSYPCLLTTSMRRKNQGSRSLRKRILSSASTEKFYAYWENCEKRAAKLFRRLYQRPYFLPAMTEMTTANWVFISQGYVGRSFKNIPIESTSVWFAQIAGESDVRLVPRKPCHKICNTLSDTLYPGDILVWNDFLWMAYYLPVTNLTAYYGSDETLAIASGLIWNR